MICLVVYVRYKVVADVVELIKIGGSLEENLVGRMRGMLWLIRLIKLKRHEYKILLMIQESIMLIKIP